MTDKQGFLFFAALYMSDLWYVAWEENPRDLYSKARAMVLFDRVMTERQPIGFQELK